MIELTTLSVSALGLIVLAYLMGSISTAIIVCRLLKLPDPRTLGSRNPGATNVMRIGGKKAAALTLAGDALKGVIPVAIAMQLSLAEHQVGWVGLAAVLGHLFPVFFGFQGGKGVATTLGVVHAWHWPTGLIIDAIWLTFAKVFRISSAAALIALAALPFILAAWQTDYWLSACIISALSLYRHKSNIQKLISGEESAIGDRVEAADDRSA